MPQNVYTPSMNRARVDSPTVVHRGPPPHNSSPFPQEDKRRAPTSVASPNATRRYQQQQPQHLPQQQQHQQHQQQQQQQQQQRQQQQRQRQQARTQKVPKKKKQQAAWSSGTYVDPKTGITWVFDKTTKQWQQQKSVDSMGLVMWDFKSKHPAQISVIAGEKATLLGAPDDRGWVRVSVER